MPRHAVLAALLLPLSLSSLACSSVQKPTAAFRSAEIGQLSAQGFTVNFAFDVNNPNGFDLPISEADYGLSLGGVKLIDDRLEPDSAIPAGGSRGVTIPVRLSFEDLLKVEKAIRAGGGDVPYEFEGALAFSGGGSPLAQLYPVRIPLRYSGTLPLRAVLSDPAVLLSSPVARRLAGRGLDSLLGR
jgi:LEA14-like dessication related protein